MHSPLAHRFLRGRCVVVLFLFLFLLAFAATAPAQTPGRIDQVVVVFKTHFDIGYTDMATSIVQRYRTSMIDAALGVVDQNESLPPSQKFVWTIPGWPMHKILEDWPGQTPERSRRVRQALERGRFVIHALPFTLHTELLEAEDLARSLGYSSSICRELGQPLPRDAKMTDVPEHTWILPTVLRHAGVEFMHIGCNGMSSPLKVPALFWWEGPDGSRVLTMYSTQYGTGLKPPEDWPCRTWLALIHTGDNHGPPRPEEVRKVLDQAAQQFPGVKVRIGRLSDFADAVLAEKPNLPVVRGDAPDTWIHGPMSDPAGMRLARAIRPLLTAAEVLNTELRDWGVDIDSAAAPLAAAHEQSLLYGEHTWGGSIGWIKNKLSFGAQFQQERAAGRFTRSEASWAEHTAYIEKACALAGPVMQANLNALAQAAGKGPRIVVFNPLPWQRDGVVGSGADEFVARGVPPLGYKTYPVDALPKSKGELRADAKNGTLENDAFKVTLDPARGTIRSLLDKRSGRELIDSAAPQGFGQYLYERFDQDQVFAYCDAYNRPGRKRHQDFDKPGLPPASSVPYRAASPSGFKGRVEIMGALAAIVMEAPAAGGLPAVTTRVTLAPGQDYVDLAITIHDKPADPWPEAGWLCLPFKVASPRFRLGRLGSIVDPARDLIPGSNRDIFSINTAMTLTDAQGRGAAVCPIDHPLVSLERPGCWRYTPDFTPTKPYVYVNLFNNQWDTNFRLWNSGTWTSRVRIWSVDRADADFVSPALEARYPLLAVDTDGGSGKLPATAAGLTLSRKGVLVGAFGPNPDGKGTLLRLWELTGQGGKLQVSLPTGSRFAKAQPCDLRGGAQGTPIAIRKAAFDLTLEPFAPCSVILE